MPGDFQISQQELDQYNDPQLERYRQQRASQLQHSPWYQRILQNLMASQMHAGQPGGVARSRMPQDPYGAAGYGLAKLLQRAIPMAHGGIVDKPTLALIGEAGPEAVVPLGRYRRR